MGEKSFSALSKTAEIHFGWQAWHFAHRRTGIITRIYIYTYILDWSIHLKEIKEIYLRPLNLFFASFGGHFWNLMSKQRIYFSWPSTCDRAGDFFPFEFVSTKKIPRKRNTVKIMVWSAQIAHERRFSKCIFVESLRINANLCSWLDTEQLDDGNG